MMRIFFTLSGLLLILIILFFSIEAAAGGLSARLERTQIAEGETVVLALSAPGDSTGTPDLSPLAQDFEVLNQAQTTRLEIINGRRSSTREWQVVLLPKRTGRLSIPPLHMGNALSEPLSLAVLPAAQAAKMGEPRAVMLEVAAKPDKPYVQGEVTYTVRLLTRVPLLQASLSAPSAGDAIVERLGEDKHDIAYRDGQQYQVIERRYAIFPQHSGSLAITPPVLSAQVADNGQRGDSLRQRMFGGRDPFADFNRLFGGDPFANRGGVFGQSRPIQLRGRSLALEVQPQPAGTSTPWLPAESLTLSEVWSPDPPVFHVGEPVTRSIAITAQGLTAAQLPDLAFKAPAGIKLYADKPQEETRADGDSLVAQKVLKAALVPATAGSFTLPAVRLAWWDIKTGKERVASLPAREVQVLPAAAGSSPPAPQNPSLLAASTRASAAPADDAAAATSPSATLDHAPAGLGARLTGAFRQPSGYWPYLALLFATAWLVSLGLWLRARSVRGAQAAERESPPKVATPKAAKVLARVEQACRAGDAGSARRALLEWAALRWPVDPPRRLEQVALRLGPEAVAALRDLDNHLYADGTTSWDGASAWRQLAPLLEARQRRGESGRRDTPLPPLYPQGA